MINLLPPAYKDGYRFARRNVALRKWLLVCIVALIGLAALATYGSLIMNQSKVEYRDRISAAKETLEKEKFKETQQRVQEITNSLKLVKQVLSQEVLFSQLLKQVGTIIPDNANLTGLTITQTQGAIDITAQAADYNTATQVQVNLSDPKNMVFSRADIVGIDCSTKTTDTSSEPTGETDYPCRVTVRALFAPDNPFLFINSKGSAS